MISAGCGWRSLLSDWLATLPHRRLRSDERARVLSEHKYIVLVMYLLCKRRNRRALFRSFVFLISAAKKALKIPHKHTLAHARVC